MDKIIYLPTFLTATIKDWKPLLKQEKYKIIILQKLKQLVDDDKIILHAYCIMHNHIHIIWQIKGDISISEVKKDFFETTAKKFKADLEIHHPQVLKLFVSTQKTGHTISGKEDPYLLIYIHQLYLNKKLITYITTLLQLCEFPEQYLFSSAGFYYNNIDEWKILTHYNL